MTPLFRFLRPSARRPCLALGAWMGLALWPVSPGATPICRWVDGQGGTQLSQEVPEAYRQSSVCTDSLQYELPPDQRRAVEQEAFEARQKALKDRDAARDVPPSAAASAAPPMPERPTAPAKRPAEVVTDATDCATWWRLFDESAECLGAYRTVRGAIKAEAFAVCNVVPAPVPVCGPRHN